MHDRPLTPDQEAAGETYINERTREAIEWIRSPEGQAAMAESARRATEMTEELHEAFRVDPESLHKPMTI